MKGELIGLPVEVVDSTNPSLKGIAGKVIDETKHFLMIESQHGRKRVQKKACTFLFRENGKELTIKGADIEVSPEERIKIKG